MNKQRSWASTAIAASVLAAIGAAPASAATVVTMNTVQIFGTIDPAKISDYTDYMAAVNLYDGLVSVDPKGNLIPELAESWKVSDDAKEVTFKLRDDAKFADGTPVQASDVIYSVERLLRINQGPANLFADVLKPGSVTAPDAKTVKFTLSKTFAPFLTTVPAIFILNEKLVKANEGSDDGQTYLATNVAGAGAYALKSWDRGAQMTIVRNPDYYKGFGEGPIDEVRWIITNDEATVRSLAASGELTMTSQFQSPETYKALVDMGRFNLVSQRHLDGVLPEAQHQGGADRRRPYPPRHRARHRLRDGARRDLPGRRAVDAAAQGLRRLPCRRHPAIRCSTWRPPRPRSRKSKYAGQPIPITLGYVAGTKFEEEISLLMQSNLEQIGFKVTQQSDPWNRITESRQGRDHAGRQPDLLRPDLSVAGLDVLHPVPFQGGRHLGVDGMAAEPGRSTR